MHLDLHQTVAFARFAAASLHIERESPRPVAADLRLRQLREQLTDRREQSRIRRRIGSWGTTDRALIDVNDFVEVLEAGDAIVLAGNDASPVEVPRHRPMQNVFDQRRLPAA